MITYEEKIDKKLIALENEIFSGKTEDGVFFVGYYIIKSWSLFGVLPLLVKRELMQLRSEIFYSFKDGEEIPGIRFNHERLYDRF